MMEGLTDSERRRLPGLDSVGRHEADDDDDDDNDGGDEVVQSPHPGEQKVQISFQIEVQRQQCHKMNKIAKILFFNSDFV